MNKYIIINLQVLFELHFCAQHTLEEMVSFRIYTIWIKKEIVDVKDPKQYLYMLITWYRT